LARGQVFAVEVIDATYALVGGEQLVGELSSVHVFDQFVSMTISRSIAYVNIRPNRYA